MKERFLADCMLGRLAKWLRILGYDTLYERNNLKKKNLSQEFLEKRRLLTRQKELLKEIPACVLIHSDHVGNQLRQMVQEGLINPHIELSLHRCSFCNTELDDADAAEAGISVPEYVSLRYCGAFKWCSSCRKYYWQGTHRDRMAAHLKAWGLIK